MFGNYVESEIYTATEKAKNAKQREQKRKQTLMMLLQEDKEEEMEEQYDPTDPIPPEVAKRMPPARKFNKKQFADPADLFKRAAQKKSASS